MKNAVPTPGNLGSEAKAPRRKTPCFVQKTFDLGLPVAEPTQALGLAAELEDQATCAKLARGA